MRLTRQQGIDEGLDIRAARQAEEASVTVQAQAQSIRSLTPTESAVTVGPRADRKASSGSQEGDLWIEDDSLLLYRWDESSVSWAYVLGFYYGSDATRTGITLESADEGLWFFVSSAGVNYGFWRVVAGVWAKQLLPASPDAATSYRVGGNDVVKARGAAVADVTSADATDLPSAITLANETKAQLNTLLARLRSTTGHGLFT
jgi:hypothetical protein